MKNYEYPILEGEIISFDDLRLPRARKMARVIRNHSCYVQDTLTYRRKKEDNEEIILMTLDIEIPQYPKNDIKVFEDVAIVFDEKDSQFPEIYALREDFKCGLPHTNLRNFKHPVSLCVTEQSFEEVKHKFNEFEFLQDILRWFFLTAEDQLHEDDQPLEPFFNIQKGIIFGNGYDLRKQGYLHRLGESELFLMNNETSEYGYAILLIIEGDTRVHGVIHKRPETISDLSKVISLKGVSLVAHIKSEFDRLLKGDLQEEKLSKQKFAIYCTIPVKRHSEDSNPSIWYNLVICCNTSFLQLGIDSDCLAVEDNNIVPIKGNNFNKDVIGNTQIFALYPLEDFSPKSAALFNNVKSYNDKLVLIGAGALGSQVFELFSRTGFCEWTIVDHDFLYPHNLAKHALDRSSIGFHKAERMARKANELHNSNLANSINENFLELSEREDFYELLKESSAIIDMSTSIAVARKLARDFKDNIKTPRISVFLNPRGSDLVILAEDKKRKCRLDFLEMQYYRSLLYEKELNDHFHFEETLKVRYNRNSCREITNRINQTDVALSASVCAKFLRQIIRKGEPSIAVWKIDNEAYEIKKYEFEPSRWVRKNLGDWKIYIDTWALDKIRKFRSEKLPNETGGILIGSNDFERKIIYVCDSILAPPDSKETSCSYERGIEGVSEEYKRYVKITDNQLMYLGEWHSHPDGHTTQPSSDDRKLYDYLYGIMSKQGYPVLMSIFGNNDCNVVFKEDTYEI